MDIINSWRLETLRIAIINDLKELVPKSHYESYVNIQNSYGTEIVFRRSEADRKLWSIVCSFQNRNPLNVTPRQVAAGDVLKWIALYYSTSDFLRRVKKFEFNEKTLPQEFKENYETMKNNLNLAFESTIMFINSLFADLDYWLLFLDKKGAKPFQPRFIKWPDEDIHIHLQPFLDKFGFIPQCILKPTDEVKKLFRIEIIESYLNEVSSQSEKVESEGVSILNESTDDEIQSLGLAEHFKPVKYSVLESMFPSVGKWKNWTYKAKENGLIAARVEGERGLFNPYLAAQWWLGYAKPRNWNMERCLKVLAKSFLEETHDIYHLIFQNSD